MKYQTSRDLIIKWTSFPEDMRETCKDRHNSFMSDTLVEFATEFEVSNDEWTMKSIEEYWKDQCAEKVCEANSLLDFITEYGLEMEVYLFKELKDFDLDSVDRVLIDICW